MRLASSIQTIFDKPTRQAKPFVMVSMCCWTRQSEHISALLTCPLLVQLLNEVCDKHRWPKAVYTYGTDPMPGSQDASTCTAALQGPVNDPGPSDVPWEQLSAQLRAALEKGQSSGLRRSQAVSKQAAAQNLLKALAPTCRQPQASIDHLINESRKP